MAVGTDVEVAVGGMGVGVTASSTGTGAATSATGVSVALGGGSAAIPDGSASSSLNHGKILGALDHSQKVAITVMMTPKTTFLGRTWISLITMTATGSSRFLNGFRELFEEVEGPADAVPPAGVAGGDVCDVAGRRSATVEAGCAGCCAPSICRYPRPAALGAAEGGGAVLSGISSRTVSRSGTSFTGSAQHSSRRSVR